MKAGDTVINENIKKNAESVFSPFDLQIGKFISSIESENGKDVHLAAALISRQLRDGHVCVRLPEFAGRILGAAGDPHEKVQFPELSTWLQSLKNADCVGIAR